MGDMETTVDDVTTDVDTELDTTDDMGDADEWVALLRKYKIDPENFTADDLVATLARLERAETAKRQEKSQKSKSPELKPTDKSSVDFETRLFFIENEEAKPFKDEFLKVKEQYPDLSFDDALELAKTRKPKESQTVKEWFQWGWYKPKPKSLEQLSETEALDLSPEKYAEYLKKTGKIM